MKNLLYVGMDIIIGTDPLFEQIKIGCSNIICTIVIQDDINTLLTKIGSGMNISCLLFDDISLGRGQIFSREETNDNRTTVVALIKTLSQNKKFDPKKIVVKIEYMGKYFDKYKKELISCGVLAENIFEKPTSVVKVSEAVVKILNNQ